MTIHKRGNYDNIICGVKFKFTVYTTYNWRMVSCKKCFKQATAEQRKQREEYLKNLSKRLPLEEQPS